jgi:rRNA processing protein Gar1
LQRIGFAIHLSADKNLIVKAEKTPKINDKVVDENLTFIGFVFDIIGPVKSPYISIKPQIPNPQRFVNKILYSLPSRRQTGKKKHE